VATMNRDAIFVLTREIVGITDETKGGLTNAELNAKVNHAISRLCLLAEAPKTVFYLSTSFNDKYLPYDDQLLWIDQVTFIPPTGQPYNLDYVDEAVFPTMNGNPRVYWHTAVNVPDPTGPSTPSLGVNPIPQVVGAFHNVRVTAYQRAKDLNSPTDIPEFVSAVHPYIAWVLAEDWLMLHPKRWAEIGGNVKARVKEAIHVVNLLTYGAHKKPARKTDVMQYSSMLSRRV